jgi:pyridoxine 5-phosphate synthase
MSIQKPKLTVNIDHVATLRQARRGVEPNPITAAVLVELAGAHGITVHLREDRRHIQDKDVYRLKEVISIPLNLEMAPIEEMVEIASRVQPQMCTLVPERREELTTEGGLKVVGFEKTLERIIQSLKKKEILVSVFIEADKEQIKAAKELGAQFVEIHTGRYAEHPECREELIKIEEAVKYSQEIGLKVNAGHGLNYHNVQAIARIPGIVELAIGHSIIARAVLVGLEKAVREMLILCSEAGSEK